MAVLSAQFEDKLVFAGAANSVHNIALAGLATDGRIEVLM